MLPSGSPSPRPPRSARRVRPAGRSARRSTSRSISTNLAARNCAARRRPSSTLKQRSSRGPAEHDLAVERAQPRRGVEQERRVGVAQEVGGVADDLEVPERGRGPARQRLAGRALGQPAERDRQPAGGREAQRRDRRGQRVRRAAEREQRLEHRPAGRPRARRTGVNTTFAIRSGRRVSSSCVKAPPVSLATIVTSVSSSEAIRSAIWSTTPNGVSAERSATGAGCEPSGSVGTMQRRSGSSSTTGSHSVPSTNAPWRKSTGGPRRRYRAVPSANLIWPKPSRCHNGPP